MSLAAFSPIASRLHNADGSSIASQDKSMPGRRAITYAKPEKERLGFYVGAFDVETNGLDGKLLLAQSYHELWSEPHIYLKVKYFLEYIFGSMDPEILSKTIWFIHHADYDLRYLFEEMGRGPWGALYDIECRERSPGKFYEILFLSKTETTRGGKPKVVARFRDSMAIFPHSLKKFTENFAPQFVKQDIGLGRGVRFDRKNPVHIEYAKNDVLGLVAAVKKFDALVFDNFQVHIKGTASSTAYAAWLRTLIEDEYIDRQAQGVTDFMRLCYNGGLVQINAIAGHHYEETTTFDINSSYPASMKLGVPKGRAVWTRSYVPGFPGFYHCTATVPKSATFPIMPAREDRNLAWARGTFETYVSSIEIEHALARGVTFEFHSGFYFPKGLIDCFSRFVGICERLRRVHKRTPLETVVKLMQNSLYGRFGMRPEGRECVVSFDGVPDGFLPVIDEDTAEAVPNVYWKNVIREAEYMIPHIAAWITANSRILIDLATEAAGRDLVLYRDTDSITIIGSGINDRLRALIGEDYGLLKNEGQKFETRYHAPKCYTYRDGKGVLHAVYKGVPSKMLDPDTLGSLELLEALHRGETPEIGYHSSTSLHTFLKTGKKSVQRTRRGTNVENVYGHVIEAGRFRPRWIEQRPPDDPPPLGDWWKPRRAA